MTGSGKDENKRLPMLWRGDGQGLCLPPAESDQRQRLKEGVLEQETMPDSLLHYHRALLAMRAQCPEMQRGTVSEINTGIDSVAAYRVEYQGSACTVLHQLGEEMVTLPVSWPGSLLFAGDTGAGAPFVQDGVLSLPPLTSCIFR